jgi:hypothetical protein
MVAVAAPTGEHASNVDGLGAAYAPIDLEMSSGNNGGSLRSTRNLLDKSSVRSRWTEV